VVLRVDPRHGRLTSRTAPPIRRLGSNVQLLLAHPEDPLPGSSDLEATAVTANIVEEGETAALRRGNNPEVGTTVMADTEAHTVGTEVTVDTEEAMDRADMVHLPEAQLLGSNRMLATVLQAWTATASHHLRRRLAESRPHRLLATFRLLLRPHHSSEWH
jgi:hypothetical protein